MFKRITIDGIDYLGYEGNCINAYENDKLIAVIVVWCNSIQVSTVPNEGILVIML